MGKRRFKLLSVLFLAIGCILGIISILSHAADIGQLGTMFIAVAIATVLIYGVLEVVEIVTG